MAKGPVTTAADEVADATRTLLKAYNRLRDAGALQRADALDAIIARLEGWHRKTTKNRGPGS